MNINNLKGYSKTLFIPILLLLCGLYLVPLSIFELNFSKIPGDFGDARFNNYILEHGYQYIIGNVHSYWNAPFMFPYKNSITFSDNLLGTMPIYSLYRFLDFSRETSFQLWLLTLFVLNYVCTYWVLKKWSNHIILSTVGAYIFAFSILLVGNIYNVQTMPRFIIPFLFYWAWLYLKEKQLINLYKLGLGLVFQFYCGIYLGFYTFYVLLFFVLAYLIIFRDKEFYRQFNDKTIVLKTLSAIVISSALLLPLMLPYYENSKIHGLKAFDEVTDTLPLLRSYFFTSKDPVFWQFLSEHGTKINLYWCHFLFLGALPWIAILLSPIVIFSKKVVKHQKQIILALLLGLALSMFFTLNFISWTPYELIYNIPGFSSMRSVNRIINTEVVFFILILVFVFKELIRVNTGFRRIILILPVLVVLDNLIYPQNIMRFDKQASVNEIENVKANIIIQNKNNLPAIAYMPFKNTEAQNTYLHISAMLATQELGLSCVNAYTGSYPKGYYNFWSKMDVPSYDHWVNLNKSDHQKIQIINEIGINEDYRTKVSLRSVESGKYICIDESIDNEIVVDRASANNWETFHLVSFNDSLVLLFSTHKIYFSLRDDDSKIISVDNLKNDRHHLFKMIHVGKDTVVFMAQNQKYVSLNLKLQQLFAIGEKITSNEKFILEKK